MSKAMAANKPRVQYKDLRDYLKLLESAGLLHRIKAEVDLNDEIGAITARSLERGGPALFFENIKGYQGKPLVSNIISSTKQLAVTFNTEADEELIHERVVEGMNQRIASVVGSTGPCKEVIIRGDDIDIFFIPTPHWHELDGGQYLGTTAGIITRDPHHWIFEYGLVPGHAQGQTDPVIVGRPPGARIINRAGRGRPHFGQ